MRRGGRVLLLAAAASLGAIALAALLPPPGPPARPRGLPDGANAGIVRIVDGDTLIATVAGREEPVRLIGIDTPESVARDRPRECFGPEASRRLAELVPPGTPVRLERDLEPRDAYGRLLAYVHRAGDGLHVNLAQVEEGYAEAAPYPPNTTLAAELAAAQRSARRAGAGLWGACGSADVPLDARRTRDAQETP